MDFFLALMSLAAVILFVFCCVAIFVLARDRFLKREDEARTITIPAGTRIATSDGRIFITTAVGKAAKGNTITIPIVAEGEAGRVVPE